MQLQGSTHFLLFQNVSQFGKHLDKQTLFLASFTYRIPVDRQKRGAPSNINNALLHTSYYYDQTASGFLTYCLQGMMKNWFPARTLLEPDPYWAD